MKPSIWMTTDHFSERLHRTVSWLTMRQRLVDGIASFVRNKTIWATTSSVHPMRKNMHPGCGKRSGCTQKNFRIQSMMITRRAQDPAPALQHAPPVPTHSLPNGQATLALTDGKEGPQTAAASDPWGSYDPSGASHDNDSHSHQTPWTDSWASGWAKTSWSNKHWGLGE